jgi:hypothetical protein
MACHGPVHGLPGVGVPALRKSETEEEEEEEEEKEEEPLP